MMSASPSSSSTAKKPLKSSLKSPSPDEVATAARIRAAAELKASQLHQTAKSQQQWSEWITKVQMKLIESHVDPSTMQRASMVLRPNEYEEVLEERIAGKMCAFPTCSNLLKEEGGGKDESVKTSSSLSTPKKYHLSLKSQRVYDISQSQQYCSETCFISSEVYKKGLREEPFYLRQMIKKANATATTVAATTTGATNEEKSNDESQPDANTITQLHIVEKTIPNDHIRQPPSKTTQSQVTAATTAATVDALAVEGYRPKSGLKSTIEKTNQPTEAAAAATSLTPSVPLKTDADGSAITSTTAPSSKPSVHFASPSPAISTFPSAAPSSSSSHEFLDFTPLPSRHTLEPFVPLSRADFEALSPEEQLDHLGQMALHEKQQIQTQTTTTTTSAVNDTNPIPAVSTAATAAPAAVATTATPTKSSSSTSTSATPSSSLESGEKKIRRRKTTAEKERPNDTNNVDVKPPSTPTPSSSSSTTSISTSTPKAKPAAASSSFDLLCDDDGSDPIITPADIKANISLIRNTSLSPFLGVLQSFMRWTTLETGRFIRTGRTSSMIVQSNRPRQNAFLNMIQQHWSQLLPILHLRQQNCQRELKDLSDTFSFDDSIPSLNVQQWRFITLILMRGVFHRMINEERRQSKNDADAADATKLVVPTFIDVLQPFSNHTSRVELDSSLKLILKQSDFVEEQFDSLYAQWMMQTEEMYGK